MTTTTNRPKSKVAQKRESKAESVAWLRKHLPRGATVYTILASVSRSGMYRHIRPIIVINGEPVDITWRVSEALGWRRHDDGVGCDGCGMDIGFHLVYSLGYALHGVEAGQSLNQRWL